jgi:hypothetical protein
LVIEVFASCPFFLPRVEASGQGCGGQSVRAACQQTYERLHAHPTALLNLVGLMEPLVVLRPEHSDLSREFSSSFVLRDLVDLAKRVANS